MKFLSTLLAGAALFCMAGAAHAYTVYPLVHDLSASQASSSLTVDNSTGTEPVTMSVEAFLVTDLADPAASRTPTDDLIVFPPQAIIPPGGKQTLRVQLSKPPSGEARTYHIVVTQVPVDLNATAGGNLAMKIGVNFFARVTVGAN